MIVNTGLVNMMDLDHRIVPWDTVRSIMLTSHIVMSNIFANNVNYFPQARLTVIVNTGLVNMMDLDHRIVPWDTVRSRAVLVSVLHQDEVTWTRDPSRDILLWPGIVK